MFRAPQTLQLSVEAVAAVVTVAASSPRLLHLQQALVHLDLVSGLGAVTVVCYSCEHESKLQLHTSKYSSIYEQVFTAMHTCCCITCGGSTLQ